MIAADIGRLHTLLSRRLPWTRASGHCEGTPRITMSWLQFTQLSLRS
jgi:hypothetical protein